MTNLAAGRGASQLAGEESESRFPEGTGGGRSGKERKQRMICYVILNIRYTNKLN